MTNVNKSGVFTYKNLSEILEKLDDKNISSIQLQLLISLGRGYYEGESLYNLISNIKTQLLNNSNYIIFNNKKVIVESFSFAVGDILNRHNWYYDFAYEYMQKHNLSLESHIPENIKDELKDKSYQRAALHGQEWFSNNIDAINTLLPENQKINSDFKINNELNVVFEGDSNTPKIQYIGYKNWMKHPRYKIIEDAIHDICNSEESNVLKRHFEHEADYFCDRHVKMGKKIEDRNFFVRQSYKYLINETMPYIIKNSDNDNIVEMYFNSDELKSSKCFKGHKAQNTPIIKKYLQNELRGADQRKFVSVKLAE